MVGVFLYVLMVMGLLGNGRYRTQLCNDGTHCKRRVCFFAHTASELRVPESKPFVNPQALAAATAAAAARRSSNVTDMVRSSTLSCFEK